MSNKWKKDFPIFKRKIRGKQLVYLDNAATAQTPKQVIDAVVEFETRHRANVHRGVHTLSEEATELYENARSTVAKFINAVVPSEVIFVRNTTEAINLVANSWGKKNISSDDVVLVSEVEHHSNLIPWQSLCRNVGARLGFIGVNNDGELEVKKVRADWGKVKLVSIAHISNVLGTVSDVRSIVKAIKKECGKQGIDEAPKVLLDGAQSVPHMPVNVQKLGVDFLAFSGHKMYGPMGVGVLWARREILKDMKPFLTGGGMIHEVTLNNAIFAPPPERFEAGTPNVAGAIGLAAACDYLSFIGMDKVRRHEVELTKYAMEELQKRSDISIYGTRNPERRGGLIAFNLKGVPSHDLATILDSNGVAIRSGHHCVMPWHEKQKITTTARVSFALYNSKKDINALLKGLGKVKEIFRGVG